MRKKLRKFFLGILSPLAVFLLLEGCFNREDFDLNRLADDGISYDIALPLTDVRLTMENLMSLLGGALLPDEEGLLYLTYTMDPFYLPLMQNTSISAYISAGFTTPAVPYFRIDTTLSISFHDSVSVPVSGLPGGMDVRRLYLESAHLAMSIENLFDDAVDLNIVFSNFYDVAGQPLRFTYHIEPAQREIIDMDLENVSIRCEGKGIYVLKDMTAVIALQADENDNGLHTGKLAVNGSFTDFRFKRVEGFIPTTDFSAAGQMSIAGLGVERMKATNLHEVFMETEVTTSGFSAPVRIDSNVAVLGRENGPSSVFSIFPENYDLEYAPLNAEPLSKTSYVTTSIRDLIVDNPSSVSIALAGRYNPDTGNRELQAIEQNSGIGLTVSCRTPLWFSADEYSLSDTMTVSLDQLPDETKINYFELKTVIINAFPLEFKLDVTFLDRDKQPLFTLFEDRLIESPEVGPEPGLHVVEPVFSAFDDELIAEQVEMVKTAAYVAIKGRMSTSGGKEVKIYMPTETEGFLRARIGFRTRITQNGLFGGGNDE